MSIFSMPDAMAPDMTQYEAYWDKMAENYAAAMPSQMGGAFNLMAHPAAGFAAMSAIGLGVASQTLGLWMGAMTGVAESSRRILATDFDETPRPMESGNVPTASGAAAAANTLAEEARIAARDASEVAAESASNAVKDMASAAETVTAEKPKAKIAPATPAAGGFVAPATMDKPAAPDDLKAISGVGPKLEQVLNSFGIWTYDQIGALTDAEIGWLDDKLGFAGRIARDDWVTQAGQLAEKIKSGAT